jgi:hypothetical protein
MKAIAGDNKPMPPESLSGWPSEFPPFALVNVILWCRRLTDAYWFDVRETLTMRRRDT